LQSMVEVSAEKNSTLIFPIPIELMEFAKGALGGGQYNRKPAAMAYPPEEEPKPTIRVSDPIPRELP
jgi:hypothetical protein